MTAMDVQMRAWRSSLEMWRRMFDLQVEMGQQMLRASSAWSPAPRTGSAEAEAADPAAASVAKEEMALPLVTAETAVEAVATSAPEAPMPGRETGKDTADKADEISDNPLDAAAKAAAGMPSGAGTGQSEKPATPRRKRN